MTREEETTKLILGAILNGEKIGIYMPTEEIKAFPLRLQWIPIAYESNKENTFFTFANGAEVTLISPIPEERRDLPEPVVYDESSEMTEDMWEFVKQWIKKG